MRDISQRLEYLDLLKGLAMFSVIYCHVLVLYFSAPASLNEAVFVFTQAIYSFHMPLFFFISGVIHKNKGMVNAVKAAIYLIAIAQVFQILSLPLDYIANGEIPTFMAQIQALIMLRSFNIGVTWFLITLAVVRVIVVALQEYKIKGKILAIFLLITSLLLTFLTNTTAFQIQTWWSSILFYYCGFMLSPYLSIFFRQPATLVNFIIILSFTVVLGILVAVLPSLNHGCFVRPADICGASNLHGQFMVRMIIGQYGFVPLFFLSAACGILYSISLVHILTMLPKVLLLPVAWAGRNTLSLLIMNGFFLIVANPYIKEMALKDYNLSQPWSIAAITVAAHLAALPLFRPVVILVEGIAHYISERLAIFLSAWFAAPTSSKI